MNKTKSNTKSSTMIELWVSKKSISDISKELKVRYNFVYNVVSRYCRKNNITMDTHNPQTSTKKSVIIDLYFNQKLSMNKIAKKINTNTSYVWSVVNDHRLSQ